MAQSSSMIHGEVSPGFEKVRKAFTDNFNLRKELGAACCIYHKGEKVVDLWGGYRDKKNNLPWEEDTLVLVFSTTKGMASMAIAHAHSQGLFDYDDKVAQHWPAFAANGKEEITLRQLFSHKAGLPAIDQKLTLKILGDHAQMSKILAEQKPAWKPGQYHGYHALTLGWYESAFLQQIDPERRSIGQYFQEEIAKPLNLEFYIGLPGAVNRSRIAILDAYPPWKMLFNLHRVPSKFVAALFNPFSITYKMASNPKILADYPRYNDVDMQTIESPAANGIGQVRSIAKAYNEFVTGGKILNLTSQTLQALTETSAIPPGGTTDLVLRFPTTFSLGYNKPSSTIIFGSSTRSFGTNGHGGSIAFADPDAEVSFAYAPNRLGYYMLDDPRQLALRTALYDCLGLKEYRV